MANLGLRGMVLVACVFRLVYLLGTSSFIVQDGASNDTSNHISRKGYLRAKRYINWQGNVIKGRNRAPDITINYLHSHVNNDKPTNDNEAYIGFTLYKDDKVYIPRNIGIFHFVASSKLPEPRHYVCTNPRTGHANAYHYIYSICPSASTGIVASGYCRRKKGVWQYDSYTFNNPSGSYHDARYYTTNGRAMHPREITMLNGCLNGWKNGGYKSGYICDVQATHAALVASGQMDMLAKLYKQDTSNDPCGCDLSCSSSGIRIPCDMISIFMLSMIAAVMTFKL